MISNGLTNNNPSVYQDEPGFLPVSPNFTVGSVFADGNGQLICLPMTYVAQFNTVKSYTDFTALYDQYRISYVSLKIRINKGMEDNNSNWPRLEWATDRDDNGIEALPAWEQRMRRSFQFSDSNRTCTINFKPTVLVSSYISGPVGVNFDKISSMGWHNLNGIGNQVMGLGLKLYFRDWFIAANGTTLPDPIDCITITPTYYFTVRDVR